MTNGTLLWEGARGQALTQRHLSERAPEAPLEEGQQAEGSLGWLSVPCPQCSEAAQTRTVPAASGTGKA